MTVQRIALLPPAQQPAWKEYLERSHRQLIADQAFLKAELVEHSLRQTTTPPAGKTTTGLSMNQPATWYRSPEARRIADIVLSFQTPAGGWSKNLDSTRHRRAPGECFSCEDSSRSLQLADFDTLPVRNWNYVGTFDNDATTTQLRYLAKVISAPEPDAAAPYRSSFLRGLDYLFAAQYPNGGWPQVWPLQGGYHDAITYNDGAMIHVLALLREVGERAPDFAFVPPQTGARATAAFEQGLHCLLATQIQVEGRRTAWCQQHDPLTLQPTSARNYEMPAQSSAESAQILLWLMSLPKPSPEVVAAVHAAAAWLEKTQQHDVAFRAAGPQGGRLIAAPGQGPLWARFYQIGTDRPLFGDRDKTIHASLESISIERRNGYAWYTSTPQRALERYRSWASPHR